MPCDMQHTRRDAIQMYTPAAAHHKIGHVRHQHHKHDDTSHIQDNNCERIDEATCSPPPHSDQQQFKLKFSTDGAQHLGRSI